MNAETLKELLANATPGPWEAHPDDQGWSGRDAYVCIDDGSDVVAKAMCYTACSLNRKPYEANARLIALAPQLAADNIALQAEVERLREALEQLIAGYEVWDFDPSTQKLVRLPDEKQTSWIRQARAALNET